MSADRAELMQQSRFVGMITPSGNTVVERVTIAMLREFPEVSCHFSRTAVHGAVDPFPDSYDWDSMIGAARLLAHANPEIIAWSGSKAGSIAFDLDRELRRRVTAETGCRATTSTLALVDALAALGTKRVALISPYAPAYQKKVLATFAREGLDCVADACAGLTDNLSYASMEPEDIRALALQVAAAKPDAIVAWCTNFLAAPLAREIEQETGAVLLDSAALVVWHMLAMLGLDTARAAAWGRLMVLRAT
jgi:maleate isomerase